MATKLNKVLADGLGSPPKVVIGIPVLHVGGTEVHTLSLVKVLRGAGFDVSVCCYYEHQERMVRDMEASGAVVTLLGLSRGAGLFSLLVELIRFFKREAPYVVHIQYIAPGLIPIVAARLARVPTVFATVHQPGDRFRAKERFLFSIAAHLCTAFFCVSTTVEKTWFGDSTIFSLDETNRGQRHFTIYNGVTTNIGCDQHSTNLSAELKANLGLSGKQVIGVVARLRAEKGHALLLNALPMVLKVFPNAVLLVVGDGPDREKLMEQGRDLGLMPHIVWAGERSPEEVLMLYGVMNVVAVPSQFEGFGLSAVEAMAAERPVVGTRVGGLVEVIEDSVTGYLVSPTDCEAFAVALISVLNDPVAAKAMGALGRNRAAEHYSSERFGESVVSAYRYFLND